MAGLLIPSAHSHPTSYSLAWPCREVLASSATAEAHRFSQEKRRAKSILQRLAQDDLETGLRPGSEEEQEKRTRHRVALPLRPVYLPSTTPYKILSNVAGAVLSILFPCAAVVSLNAVADQNKRVGMVCGFAVLFGIGMSVCSRARRIEVFAVTAA